MDLIIGHHVDQIELKHYDSYEDSAAMLKISYDFDEHIQRYMLTMGGIELTKAQARELRDFLNGLNLEGRG